MYRKNLKDSWEEPITWKEFNQRANMSTIDAVGHEIKTKVLDQAITQAVEEAEKKQLEKIIAYMEVVSTKYHLSHHDRKPSYGSGQANGFIDAVSELKTLDKLIK